jgi:hypothetical protein
MNELLEFWHVKEISKEYYTFMTTKSDEFFGKRVITNYLFDILNFRRTKDFKGFDCIIDKSEE